VLLAKIIRVIKSRRMRLSEHVARVVESRGAYSVLVRESEGKKQLGRPGPRWEDYIEVDVQEIRYVASLVLLFNHKEWFTLCLRELGCTNPGPLIFFRWCLIFVVS